MAATIARSVLTFRLTGATASLLQKCLLSSAVSKPPPLPELDRLRISISRYAAPALSHSLRVASPIRINQIRCQVSRSGSSYSPPNSGLYFNKRPHTGTKLRTSGCDFEHWLVIIDKPGGEGATKQQMIDCYIQTLAKVLGSEEEAKKKIYNVSCDRDRYLGFGCAIDEKTSNKLEGLRLPGVLYVLPDSYVDIDNKDYGAELFVNGEIVQRSPERQRRVEPGCLREFKTDRDTAIKSYVRRRDNNMR